MNLSKMRFGIQDKQGNLMSKVNYRRLKTWKLRVKLPPNKVVTPDVIYNRRHEQSKLRKSLERYKNTGYRGDLE